MPTELDRVDVVTVGVGWTAGIIAAELTKAGYTVKGLERGEEKTLEDYLHQKDELRYALRYEMMQDLSKETITFRNNSDMNALPMRRHGSFLLGTDLGGSGVHWNGQTYRFLPYDFEIRSQTEERYGEDKIPDYMTLQDWGITYDELEPYYDRFEKTCGIAGEENPLGGPRSDSYPLPPMAETKMIRMFKEAATNLGYHPFHMPSANLTENYENPDGQQLYECQYCAFCERFGCDYGAKADPIVTVLPTAQETGNFEIRTNSNVTRILTENGEATGVLFVDTKTGEEFIQPADVVAVTSYVLNNVRLLLTSEVGTPYDPETGEGVIGKNYCYQVMGSANGFFEDEKFNTFMGAGALGAAFDDYNGDNFDHSDLDFLHGGEIAITQTGRRPINSNPVPDGTASWGSEFKEQSLKYFNRSLNLRLQGSSLPSQNNYLDLDPTYTDRYGDPLLRMTYDFTDQDRNMAQYCGQVLGEMLEEMGADHVDVDNEIGNYDIVPYQTTHNTGGVIMGEDPETSAVNNYNQMWDYDNLFVTGASAFAHNSGYNPTGTVGALAYRCAEGIQEFLDNGGGQLVEAKKPSRKMRT
ncbi:GMC family oxidoreductase [Alkalicoccus saliphilus]|jgi:gluconate 2-dehydrogenase alpha chain|uniref:GMC family oxidoreductase n=1 Tax=Alkalicoccus saliphilus TaxID=200989 RepID=A0A2T4U967_9BACI|nr:GMC family oxidoreductase [Alkalicoccus saliphilus]PTL39943.1 GMC family oxidoreductase [Alkalicoccus saliphilus]